MFHLLQKYYFIFKLLFIINQKHGGIIYSKLWLFLHGPFAFAVVSTQKLGFLMLHYIKIFNFLLVKMEFWTIDTVFCLNTVMLMQNS